MTLPTDWLSAADAARRLGVKRETLYAYVSRGLLSRKRTPGGRESLFDPAEVTRLAARHRGGGRAGALELIVDSSLTLLDPAGKLYYRGWDAEVACLGASFEEVAEWLWTGRDGAGGSLRGTRSSTSASPEGPAPAPSGGTRSRTSASPEGPAPAPSGGTPGTGRPTGISFDAPADVLHAAAGALASLPPTARPVERMRVALAAGALADPLRFDRRPEAVAAAGRRIIALLVDSLSQPDRAAALDEGKPPRPSERPIAARLWAWLSARAPTPERLWLLDAALVLLADHEMASSTLAARIAASTWADPYLVVTAGMAILGGPLHGGVSDRLQPILKAATEEGAAAALSDHWRAGEAVAGFGHMVYTGRDPRAAALWPLLQAAYPDSAIVDATADIIATVTAHGDTQPNVDLMLATLVAAAGMIPGAGEAIFAIARCAGWIGHAIEEYGHRLRFRSRAAYTGPLPGPA
jgi:citrate synthase